MDVFIDCVLTLFLIFVFCFLVLFSALFLLQLICATERRFRPNRSQIVQILRIKIT